MTCPTVFPDPVFPIVIHRFGHRLKMVRTNAAHVLAQVVDLQPLRNGTDKVFVDVTMGFGFSSDLTPAVGTPIPVPQPTGTLHKGIMNRGPPTISFGLAQRFIMVSVKSNKGAENALFASFRQHQPRPKGN